MVWTREQIHDATGFDNGDLFTSEEQVRAYFTVDNLRDMFGECPYSQEQLDEMAEAVIANRWHMVPLTWQVIEDNGGGLHLAVFEGGRVIFYGHGYEHNEDGLRADLDALRNGADPRSDAWEMPVDDPQAAYDELTSHEHGWKIVADQEGIYYDRMGAAATSAFAIPWQDLVLFNADNQDVTDPDEIRQALAEFRERESISGYFFHRIGAPHEDPEDASTWGPQSPDHVDWTGFDEALEEAYGRG